ncbi:hypothetical protein R1flu_005580 [Riccia fluitans]|uniref:Uncharacterized protein n=1 Tax=Riccia fluitans TaxID=41844 RepID=A0ABD1YU49_9MARC
MGWWEEGRYRFPQLTLPGRKEQRTKERAEMESAERRLLPQGEKRGDAIEQRKEKKAQQHRESGKGKLEEELVNITPPLEGTNGA